VYGVDINPTAVELARISVWIHTFVPGIPLSFLDWRLRCGNSIIGIATQNEANEIISEYVGQTTLFQNWQGDPTDEVAEIARQMAIIGEGSDTTLEEVEDAMASYQSNLDRLLPWNFLMDVMCASRMNKEVGEVLGRVIRDWKGNSKSILEDEKLLSLVEHTLNHNKPFHFQIAFPEVFWRKNPGFDVIVGNPPWKEATVEIDQFLTRIYPGFKGKSKDEREQIKNDLSSTRPDLINR